MTSTYPGVKLEHREANRVNHSDTKYKDIKYDVKWMGNFIFCAVLVKVLSNIYIKICLEGALLDTRSNGVRNRVLSWSVLGIFEYSIYNIKLSKKFLKKTRIINIRI